MGRITPVERNTDVLRPYGVFACIAPFNFPLALSAGMSSAALAAGNAVVYKPAEDTPLHRAPAVRGVSRRGAARRACSTCWSDGAETIGDPLWRHPGIDGVVFTGSKAVGLRIHAGLGAGVDQAVPARAGRQERGDRHAERRSRRRGGRGDALGVQPPEPEVQRHQPGLRPPRRRRAVRRAAARADPRDAHGRSLRARRLLRPGDQRARGRAVRARGRAGPRGGSGPPRRRTARRRRRSTVATSSRRPSRCCRSTARSSGRSCSSRSWRVGEVGSLDEALARDQRRRSTASPPASSRPIPPRSSASSTRSRPASATPTSAPARPPAPGPARSRSAAGRARARPARAGAGRTTSRSSRASRAAR